jgi:hypothetical protein
LGRASCETQHLGAAPTDSKKIITRVFGHAAASSNILCDHSWIRPFSFRAVISPYTNLHYDRPYPRHGRACPGHPRLCRPGKKDMDARNKSGHDESGFMKLGVIPLCRLYEKAAASSSNSYAATLIIAAPLA